MKNLWHVKSPTNKPDPCAIHPYDEGWQLQNSLYTMIVLGGGKPPFIKRG